MQGKLKIISWYGMLIGRKRIPIQLLVRLILPQEYVIFFWLLSNMERIELRTTSTSSYSFPSFRVNTTTRRVNKTDIYENNEKHIFGYTVNWE